MHLWCGLTSRMLLLMMPNHNQKIIKDLILRTTFKTLGAIIGLGSVSICSFATTNGPYVGIQVGWGYVHQGTFIAEHVNRLAARTYRNLSLSRFDVLLRDTGLAGRGFVGYQLNPYFAIEMGYYHFTPIHVKTDAYANLDVSDYLNLEVPVHVSSRVAVSTYAVDMMAKGIFPVTNCFSLYGKLGLAFVNSEGTVELKAKAIIVSFKARTTPSVNLGYPAFGLGINYDLTSHASVDMSWNRIQKVHPCPYPNIDFVSAGLLYRFS